MFLPTTKKELRELGWERCDIILVTGDSYIDSPYIGISVIGKVLLHNGFRVGIIAQPDIGSEKDISRLGEPELFWGVSGGSIDSMVANYTAIKKKKRQDDFTPGGANNKRPDRAVIVYTNLIRRYFKQTRPVVLGGLEASLRRIAHYDYWSDSIRRSILFDAKADHLIYGMGEKAVIELADALQNNKEIETIRGLCRASKIPIPDYLELPEFELVSKDKKAFADMFDRFYRNQDPLTAQGLMQKQDTRYLIHNPPQPTLSTNEMDWIHSLDYERNPHPVYREAGDVRALETIRFSIPSHRGCYGECNFCSITVHQGRTVTWRSRKSIVKEAEEIAQLPDFKGTITDIGGPTANMYGFECAKKLTRGACQNKRCLYPQVCDQLEVNHREQMSLLKIVRKIGRIKIVAIASGIRYDLVVADEKRGYEYLKSVVTHHTSGQLKLAPEHHKNRVLDLMGKPGIQSLLTFKKMFEKLTKLAGKEQYLTYYFIAAHPGCSEKDMKELKRFANTKLGILPKQVQIFTPLPSTYSAVMYHTGTNPFTGERIFVEKNRAAKERQKNALTLKKEKRLVPRPGRKPQTKKVRN